MSQYNPNTQLSIFDEKIAVDKNFSFQTLTINGELSFGYDFEESFDEPNAVISDVLLFIMKQYYDDPVRGALFKLKDYADFTGRSIQSLRKKKVEGSKQGNELERLIYKLVNRNLVIKSGFITKNNEVAKVYEPFNLIRNFVIIDKNAVPGTMDKRYKLYHVLPHKNIRQNLPSYLYYVSMKDYNLLSAKHYRNPGYRILYMRLCSLYNSLRIGRNESLSFDELAKILDYNTVEPRKAKQLITKSLKMLLSMESLNSLAFKWTTSDNGKYKYRPYFYVNGDNKNLLTEKSIDKFKRLDMLIIDNIREFIPFDISTMSFEYEDFISLLKDENVKLYDIFSRCYLSNFGKEPGPDSYPLFYEHFVYKDDFGNIYGSALLKYCNKHGKKLLHDTHYTKARMLS